METYPLGSTVQVQIEDRRAFKRETHKKNGTFEMQSKPALARMCLKIWNGDFLSFAPFKGLQIELASIVLLPIRKHAGTILSSLVQQQLAIVGSIWLHPWKSLHRPGYFGGKWWTSQSGKLRGWHCGPTRLAFTVPWRCLKMSQAPTMPPCWRDFRSTLLSLQKVMIVMWDDVGNCQSY